MNRESKIILVCEGAGFLLISVIIWLSVMVKHSAAEPTLSVFGGTWQHALVETLLIVPLAIFVIGVTVRYLRRISRLESLMNVCPVCKRIEMDGAWNTPEHHMHGKLEDDVAASICPECYQSFYRDLMIEKQD